MVKHLLPLLSYPYLSISADHSRVDSSLDSRGLYQKALQMARWRDLETGIRAGLKQYPEHRPRWNIGIR